MYFVPLDRMWERVKLAREDSDTTLFYALLAMGEMLIKTISAGLVATVDDINRDRYTQLYHLVRATGIGDWTQVLNDVLTGPASQHLMIAALEDQRELTQRVGAGSWQYAAVNELHSCLQAFGLASEPVAGKVSVMRWLEQFVVLRNKTKGHGAPLPAECSVASPPLERSIRLVAENLNLFHRPWAYLHRNVSGKYRVSAISADSSVFAKLKTSYAIQNKVAFSDGIYVDFAGEIVRVELMLSDPDLLDVFYMNGGVSGKRFEWLSYSTGDIRAGDLTPYLAPASELPSSVTQGYGTLEVQGEVLGNLPPKPHGYITRERLERELYSALQDDRHPVVTLRGRGGIGKTSLALTVLHHIARQNRFGIILWFSARDIDLELEGPKQVKPHILTEKDVARDLVSLLEPPDIPTNHPLATRYLASTLTKSPFNDMPILFVFDNFETVRSPQDLYAWIDQYIRSPNKVLITTRWRDFRGDFPVEVTGMTDEEGELLIDSTAHTLSIHTALSSAYRQELIRESDGHPYVIKVLLGEVKKTGQAQGVKRIAAGGDDILDALFERTYAMLSAVAQRLFLTLCSWRSVIPQLAVEAVLLRPQQEERMDVEHAVEELEQSSLIEVNTSDEDQTQFLSVPLVAAIFGKSKLKVSAWSNVIEEDVKLLRNLGAAQHSEIRRGSSPQIERMAREFAQRAAQSVNALEDYVPILEFIARKHPPTWMLLASVYEDEGPSQSLESARAAVIRYLEATGGMGERTGAWQRLADLCRRMDDIPGEIHALAAMCQEPNILFTTLSDAVGLLNGLFPNKYRLDTDDRRAMVQRVAAIIGSRVADEGYASDCSRVAWLYLYLHDDVNARKFTEIGLAKDADNEHCYRLGRRLGLL